MYVGVRVSDLLELDNCKLSCAGVNLGSLEKQPVLSTTETSVQCHIISLTGANSPLVFDIVNLEHHLFCLILTRNHNR